MASLVAQPGKCSLEYSCQCWRCKRHQFDPWIRKIPPEKEVATHPNIFAWKIPWIEEHGVAKSWLDMTKHPHAHTHNMSLLSLLFILFTFCYHYLLHNSLVLFFITCLPSLKLYHMPFNPYLLYTSKISLQVLKIPPEISTLQKGFLTTSIFTRVLVPT